MVRVVRVVGQDALGDAARRRLADGQRRDAVEWFRGLDGGEIESSQGGPRRVFLVRRRHEDEGCPWVPFPERGALLRKIYTRALYEDPGATLDDLNEAVEMLEEATRTARRVLGGAHPLTYSIERILRTARANLRARETPPSSA